MPELNLETLGSDDLLSVWEDLLMSAGGSRALAAKENRPNKRRQLWAIANEVTTRAFAYKLEIYKRLGVPFENSPAMQVYAAAKHGKPCDDCKGSGGMRSRFMHFYTTDRVPEPLPLMLIKGGCGPEELKTRLKTCALLCNRCAAKKGVKFTKAGKPIY